jgi:type I restriction enzyme M protein
MAKIAKTTKNSNNKTFSTQQSVNQAIKSICDVMRRSNCAGALQYVPELTWLLFLRILDEREEREASEQSAIGLSFQYSIKSPFRWRDWAAPFDDSLLALDNEGRSQGWKRKELQAGELNKFIKFVNEELLPELKKLSNQTDATPRQKVISEILSGIEKTRIDTDTNLQDVLDKIHEIQESAIDTTHVFPLSQVFEGLLLKMGEKGNDGGQFFTPREVIRTMVKVVDPKIGETVYDPACGTGGFLAQSYEHMIGANKSNIKTGDDLNTLKHKTFYGREKDNTIYPIGLANLILHEIDEPHIWHGNTLTGNETYGGLFTDAPTFYDVILMNPPFGGKEGKDAQKNFDYETGATQVLFLQYAIASLKNNGRCGIVLDEGVLFRTNEDAFVKTKKKLLDDCDLYCIVSLPSGVFTTAGAGVKTNLLFFTKGKPTEKTWYYDLSDLKVNKTHPLTLDKFDEFFSLLATHANSVHSWTMDFTARKQQAKQQTDPLRTQAEKLTNEATSLREQIKE